MSRGKRSKRRLKRGPRRKSVEALERGLQQMTMKRGHHADRIKTLDKKIAAQEGLIELTKEEEADANGNDSRDG